MKAFQIAKFAGIPIKVHWTFGLLIVLVLGYGLAKDIQGTDLLWFIGFIGAMFICVILHEYGHALSARKYGVKTVDIIISPIGGLARLERLPKRPLHEMIVAIAGPAVNVVIGLIIFFIMYLLYNDLSFLHIGENFSSITNPKGFFGLLIWTNAILFFFNLIPAFPMDGGRILRALLTIKYGRIKATQWAALVGRILAIMFIVFAIFIRDYTLIFIGIFIFIVAGSESQQVVIENFLEKATTADIMNTSFSKIHLSESLDTMFDIYIRGGERNFLIFDSLGNISGVIPELFLKQAYKEGKLSTTTANEYMSNNILKLSHTKSLKDLFTEMNSKGVAIAAIVENEQIVGVIDRSMLKNYIQLNM